MQKVEFLFLFPEISMSHFFTLRSSEEINQKMKYLAFSLLLPLFSFNFFSVTK